MCQRSDNSDICQTSAKWCFQLLFRNISWEYKWLKPLSPQCSVGFVIQIKQSREDEQQIREEKCSILLNTASQQIQSHIFLGTRKRLFVSIADNMIFSWWYDWWYYIHKLSKSVKIGSKLRWIIFKLFCTCSCQRSVTGFVGKLIISTVLVSFNV